LLFSGCLRKRADVSEPCVQADPNLSERELVFDAVASTMRQLRGSYSIISLISQVRWHQAHAPRHSIACCTLLVYVSTQFGFRKQTWHLPLIRLPPARSLFAHTRSNSSFGWCPAGRAGGAVCVSRPTRHPPACAGPPRHGRGCRVVFRIRGLRVQPAGFR
jgi:hypothetical protein